MGEQRRTATLLAAARQLETDAGDDALDLLDQLLGALLARADRAGTRERLRTLPTLDLAASQLRDAVKVLLDPPAGDLPALWAAIGRTVSREQLTAAVEAVDATTRPAADTHLDDLLARYSLVRRFLPTLLASLRLQAAPAGVDVLAAWEALGALEGRRSVRADEVPLTLATGPWVTRVHGPDGLLHRPAFTLLVLERLREALRRRDVYATTSRRWSDPRAQLLSGSAWEAARAGVATSLGHDLDPHRELAELAADLDGAYRAVAGRIADNAAVRIETADGHDRLVLTPLDRLDEPPSLLALRAAVDDLLPRVDLPDVLLEVAGWTGFINEFTHVSEGTARAADLGVSICAVLVAEACNIGLEPVVQPGNPALSRGRLSWADQNYLRGDTITAATGRMVDAQSEIPLARQWGGGEVASADGLRFVVPVRTLNAGPNPRYFGPGRGVTYLNFLSDQFAGFHAIVVPGTLRDSLHILDGLLEQQTTLQPAELMTDTAGYSDQVFGLFRLLGYQFSPRLADIGSARFWRITRNADYGPLGGLARHHINTDLIAAHWDDLLRVAGSLATGTVRASELLRVLQGGGRPPRSDGPSPSSAGSPRPCTCSPTSTTRPTAGASSPSSTAPRAGTPSHGPSSTASAGSCASATAKARKTSSARSASSLMPSCCGTPATRTPPWTSYAATVTTSATTTYDACHPSATTTSTSSAATSSAPPTSPTDSSAPYATPPPDNQPRVLSARSCAVATHPGMMA